jgi:acylphosphatase
MEKHFTIVVGGKVQGVFFRASAREKADELHIRGFVRNQADGSVYIEAEGDEENLKEFIRWCHHGPPQAKIEKSDLREGTLKHFTEFTIQR